MIRNEVTELMKRVKSNYPSFIIDDFKINEWLDELKDYDNEDVHKKLEEHMRNEEYNAGPPKVYFLTRYLIKIKDKKTLDDYKVVCPFCRERISYNNNGEHIDRCRSIDYIDTQCKKYHNKRIDKEAFKRMTQDQFDIKYNRVLKDVYDNTTNETEKKVISKILYDTPLELKDVGVY